MFSSSRLFLRRLLPIGVVLTPLKIQLKIKKPLCNEGLYGFCISYNNSLQNVRLSGVTGVQTTRFWLSALKSV